MKFNMCLLPKLLADEETRARKRPIGRNTVEYRAMLDDVTQLALAADEYGYDSFSTTEHHFHTEGVETMPAPMLLYTKLAQMTKNLRFMPLSIVLPVANPLRVAEEVALFDNMFPGRISLGVARGYQGRWMQTISQKAPIASGNPASDALNREIFDEHLEVLLKAWTEDAFQHNGKHFQVPYPASGIEWPVIELSRQYGSPGEVSQDGHIVQVGVVPAPVQTPHPDIWIPFTLSAATLTMAASRGYKMIINQAEPETFATNARTYQAKAAEFGHELALGENLCAVRHIAIADSYDEAFDIATRTAGYDFFHYFQPFGFMENWRNPDDAPKFPLTFDRLDELTRRMVDKEWILCGTPDQVNEQMERLSKCHTGDGELEYFCWNNYAQGNLSIEESRRQMTMVAEHVMPNFR